MGLGGLPPDEEASAAPWWARPFPTEAKRHPPCIRTSNGSRRLAVLEDAHITSSSDEEEEEESTTPTARGARIPVRLPCPPAPRKRRQAAGAAANNGNRREFFLCPPDLEAVFARRELPAK